MPPIRDMSGWRPTTPNGARRPACGSGSGMAGIDGLDAGDLVTAEQMRSLFGEGRHPLAGQLAGSTGRRRSVAASLGLPFNTGAGEVTPFQREVAARFAAFNLAAGAPAESPIPADERARIRSEVAREFFRAEHGRDPADARELSGMLAKLSRPRSTDGRRLRPHVLPGEVGVGAVGGRRPENRRSDRAGAPGSGRGRAAVPRAARPVHPRGQGRGAAGRRPRARGGGVHAPGQPGRRPGPAHPCGGGEQGPDAAREVAVDRRTGAVQGQGDGVGDLQHRPRTPPQRPARRPVRRTARHGSAQAAGAGDRRRRPGAEPAVVGPAEGDRGPAGELASRFQHDHGRPPTPVEALQLAQQATLETRNAKHEPRTLAEQRATWQAEAVHVLGGEQQLRGMLHAVLHHEVARRR